MEALQTLIIAIISAFLGSWLGSYLSEKGKNLATKEDIANITREIEEVKTIYKSKYDLSKTEREFYNDMTEALQSFLSRVKRYELASGLGENSLTHPMMMEGPDLKKTWLDFVDKANELLAKAFVFMEEEHYRLLFESMKESTNFAVMRGNFLDAMRKSIHKDTQFISATHSRDIKY